MILRHLFPFASHMLVLLITSFYFSSYSYLHAKQRRLSTCTSGVVIRQPTTAVTVDGLIDDWDLTNDKLADMCEAGNCGKNNAVLASKAYARYYCSTKLLCLLVLAEDSFVLAPASGSQSWFKDYDITNSVQPAVPPGVTDVLDGNSVVGWEACFSHDPACVAEAEIHANFGADATSAGRTTSTGKSNGDGLISLDLTCGGTVAECGNGVLDSGEACDPGILDGNPDYVAGCRAAGQQNECTYCGDGNVDDGSEYCDGNFMENGNVVVCREDCTYCGDGVKQDSEACDPNDPDAPADCLLDCTLNTGDCPLACLDDGPTLNGTPMNDVTVSCDAIPDVPPVTVSSCDTAIDGNEITPDEVINGDCGSTITRTWKAIDCHSQSVVFTQTMTLDDNEAPTLTLPDDATVSCEAIDTDTGSAIAFDNCDGDLTVSFADSVDTKPTCGSFTRAWTATDCSGNSKTQSQTITVVDDGNPSVTEVPIDQTLNCRVAPSYEPVWEDACSPINPDTEQEEVLSSTLTDTCRAGVVVLTWTAEDDCGNQGEVSQTLTYNSASDPVLAGIEGDFESQCEKDSSALPFSSGVTASDDCDDNVIVSSSDDDQRGTTCPLGVATRTWTATSCDGGETIKSQTITVIDEVAPTLTPDTLTDSTVYCDPESPDAPLPFMAVTASDGCDPSVSLLSSDTCEEIEGGAIFTRSWTATDCAGNQNSVDESFTQLDKCLFTIDYAFSGEPVEVEFDIADGDNGVEILVSIVDGTWIGDMRGVFLNLESGVANTLQESDVTATLVTGTSNGNDVLGAVKIDENGVVRVKNDVNMNGGGNPGHVFDIGIEIGTRGISTDDIRAVLIIINNLSVAQIVGEAGVRLTSVGQASGDGRGLSSKTVGESVCCTPSCPDHTTPVCGNNVVEPGEECDDGNTDNNDGCSSSCVHGRLRH